MSLFAQGRILYVIPKDSTQKLLGVINNFSRAPEHKTNIKGRHGEYRLEFSAGAMGRKLLEKLIVEADDQSRKQHLPKRKGT